MVKEASCRNDFCAAKNLNPSGVLAELTSSLIGEDAHDQVVAAAFKVAEAASLSHAKNKSSIMSSGSGRIYDAIDVDAHKLSRAQVILAGVLAQISEALESRRAQLIEGAASLVKVLCAEDCDVVGDEPASRGFSNARTLADLGIPGKLCVSCGQLLGDKGMYRRAYLSLCDFIDQ